MTTTTTAAPLRPWTEAERVTWIRSAEEAWRSAPPPELEEIARYLELPVTMVKAIRAAYWEDGDPLCRMVARYKLSAAAIKRIGRSLTWEERRRGVRHAYAA